MMKVGGHRLISIDVRVIAATNKNLRELVAKGKFREDLYYRLLVLPVNVPPLRERKEDIPLLVEHFITKHFTKEVKISEEVMEKLIEYNWPGNVRELESVILYMTSLMEAFL